MEDLYEKEKLHYAVQDGDIEKVQALILDGAKVNAFDQVDKTPLHYAVEKEDFKLIDLLLAAGADPNAHNKANIGNTPLHNVASNCSLKLAQRLIDAGADPRIPGWMQITALDIAKKRKRGDGPLVYKLFLNPIKSAASQWHKLTE
jgi:ankyrin repeat protein